MNIQNIKVALSLNKTNCKEAEKIVKKDNFLIFNNAGPKER